MEKEENAIILEYLPNGYPMEKKMMPIAQAIGEKTLVLLELVPRRGVDLKIGDKCFIYRDSSVSKIVDPCLVYEVDKENELKYSIMYFSNFGVYGQTTGKLEINGYNFAKVYPTEIGLTPEEAVKNMN